MAASQAPIIYIKYYYYVKKSGFVLIIDFTMYDIIANPNFVKYFIIDNLYFGNYFIYIKCRYDDDFYKMVSNQFTFMYTSVDDIDKFIINYVDLIHNLLYRYLLSYDRIRYFQFHFIKTNPTFVNQFGIDKEKISLFDDLKIVPTLLDVPLAPILSPPLAKLNTTINNNKISSVMVSTKDVSPFNLIDSIKSANQNIDKLFDFNPDLSFYLMITQTKKFHVIASKFYSDKNMSKKFRFNLNGLLLDVIRDEYVGNKVVRYLNNLSLTTEYGNIIKLSRQGNFNPIKYNKKI